MIAASGLGFLAFTLAAGADVGTVGSALGPACTVTVDGFDFSTPNGSILERRRR